MGSWSVAYEIGRPCSSVGLLDKLIIRASRAWSVGQGQLAARQLKADGICSDTWKWLHSQYFYIGVLRCLFLRWCLAARWSVHAPNLSRVDVEVFKEPLLHVECITVQLCSFFNVPPGSLYTCPTQRLIKVQDNIFISINLLLCLLSCCISADRHQRT